MISRTVLIAALYVALCLLGAYVRSSDASDFMYNGGLTVCNALCKRSPGSNLCEKLCARKVQDVAMLFSDDEEEEDVEDFLSASMVQWPEPRVTTNNLNVRNAPSTKGTVLSTLPSGTEVIVYGVDGDWAQIGSGRYVHRDYLSYVARCTTEALNVRNSPSKSGQILKTLAKGARVTFYEKGADVWVRIGNGQWVHGDYLANCSGGGGKSKEEEALEEIFGSEGQCQNWKEDTGNWFNGKLGYTCMGITPSVGFANRNGPFSYALNACSGKSAELFVKCAYDLNRVQFKTGTAEVYMKSYFGPGGCSPLAQPAFYVCADISVNSGPGRSTQYIRELGGPGSDIKAWAHRLNDRHRQDYIKWSEPGTGNERFRAGWLARAKHRDEYIVRY